METSQDDADLSFGDFPLEKEASQKTLKQKASNNLIDIEGENKLHYSEEEKVVDPDPPTLPPDISKKK